MKLLLDILQGAGVACATGIRPFLPALAVGALARADIGVDFDGTEFAFLEDAWFLLALAAALVASTIARAALAGPAPQSMLAGIGLGLGALLFAATLDDQHATWWPGLIAGLACAALASAATRSLLTRTRARLDAQAAAALFVYAEAAALVLAGLAVLVPPVSAVAIAFFGWLLAGEQRRGERKFAGLRILR